MAEASLKLGSQSRPIRIEILADVSQSGSLAFQKQMRKDNEFCQTSHSRYNVSVVSTRFSASTARNLSGFAPVKALQSKTKKQNLSLARTQTNQLTVKTLAGSSPLNARSDTHRNTTETAHILLHRLTVRLHSISYQLCTAGESH